MAAIRFYFDEMVPVDAAEQLQRRGIDAITAHDLGVLSDSDLNHLERATNMGRVVCTNDQDFLRMARAGIEHAGIVFGQQRRMSIGAWVRALVDIHERFSVEDMINRVEFI